MDEAKPKAHARSFVPDPHWAALKALKDGRTVFFCQTGTFIGDGAGDKAVAAGPRTFRERAYDALSRTAIFDRIPEQVDQYLGE